MILSKLAKINISISRIAKQGDYSLSANTLVGSGKLPPASLSLHLTLCFFTEAQTLQQMELPSLKLLHRALCCLTGIAWPSCYCLSGCGKLPLDHCPCPSLTASISGSLRQLIFATLEIDLPRNRTAQVSPPSQHLPLLIIHCWSTNDQD